MEKRGLRVMSPRERDIYFLREAFKAAKDLSQDANTQTGSILVNPSLEIISRGANRMHFGTFERYEGKGERNLLGRPEKYDDLTHGEKDCIFSANREGKSLVGYTIYGTWTPCEPCSEVIINNGIIRFVTHQSTANWYNEAHKNVENRINWEASIEKAIEKLQKAGVEYQCLSDQIGGVEILFDDKIRAP